MLTEVPPFVTERLYRYIDVSKSLHLFLIAVTIMICDDVRRFGCITPVLQNLHQSLIIYESLRSPWWNETVRDFRFPARGVIEACALLWCLRGVRCYVAADLTGRHIPVLPSLVKNLWLLDLWGWDRYVLSRNVDNQSLTHVTQHPRRTKAWKWRYFK